MSRVRYELGYLRYYIFLSDNSPANGTVVYDIVDNIEYPPVIRTPCRLRVKYCRLCSVGHKRDVLKFHSKGMPRMSTQATRSIPYSPQTREETHGWALQRMANWGERKQI